MTQNGQEILKQISQLARELEQIEASNAVKLQQGTEMSTEEQQKFAVMEQSAAQQLGQIQQLIDQYQQLSSSGQSFQSSTGSSNAQFTSAQSPFQPGFAGTNAEEVRQQNQQSAQNKNSGNSFS